MSRGRTRGRRGRAEIITEEARGEDGIGLVEAGSGRVEDGELPGEQREEDAEQDAEMVRAALSDGDQEAALDTLDAFAEALKQYKKDVLTADSKFMKFLFYWQISGAELEIHQSIVFN